MNCQKIAEILDESDSRRLDGAERHELATHLDGCGECRAAFAAHEAMQGMAVPSMSPGLAERCRRMVVAQSAGTARRAVGRPFLVVGLLVAGAAAATFVGIELTGHWDTNGDASADPVLASDTVAVTGEPPVAAAANIDAAAAVTDSESPDDSTTPSGGFTVAVSYRQLATSPDLVLMAETLHRVFLEELRKIPDLELIEVEAGDDGNRLEFAPVSGAISTAGPVSMGIAVEPPASGAAPPAAIGTPGGPDGTAGRTLVLVDSSRFTDPGAAGFGDLNALPTALVGRIETVTGGASATYSADAMAGVVNVILGSNMEGVRVDLSYDSAGVAAIVEEPLAYDYELDVIGSERGESLSFSVRGRSSGNSTSISTSAGRGAALEPTTLILPIVSHLQVNLFPVDPAMIAARTQRVMDTRLPIEDRIAELRLLQQLASRASDWSLSNDVVLAIVDMASRITDDQQRARLWRQIQGVDHAALIQPLSNSLRNDTSPDVRLAAVSALAGFQRDPMARAALELAANVDATPEVRTQARWAALDEAGRRNLVVATLFDTRLGDAERIEPLLSNGGLAPATLGPAIDVAVAGELATLLRRLENPASRANLLYRLERESSTALAPLLLERLSEDPVDVVRTAAATALQGRFDEPGVRSGLERAAATDPSARVRDRAARVLETAD